MRLRILPLCISVGLACDRPAPRHPAAAAQGGAPAAAAPDVDVLRADSISLERTGCYGDCPAYRVSIDRDRVVRFHPYTPGDSAPTTVDTVRARRGFSTVIFPAFSAALPWLPDSIDGDKRFCRSRSTDMPYATVAVYSQGRTKRVVDYLGCAWAPGALRDLERAIDSVAGIDARGRRPAMRNRLPRDR